MVGCVCYWITEEEMSLISYSPSQDNFRMIANITTITSFFIEEKKRENKPKFSEYWDSIDFNDKVIKIIS